MATESTSVEESLDLMLVEAILSSDFFVDQSLFCAVESYRRTGFCLRKPEPAQKILSLIAFSKENQNLAEKIPHWHFTFIERSALKSLREATSFGTVYGSVITRPKRRKKIKRKSDVTEEVA